MIRRHPAIRRAVRRGEGGIVRRPQSRSGASRRVVAATGPAARGDGDTSSGSIVRRADPNGVAPDGLSVLAFALLKYWNGEAVDVIAQRATARSAWWIAAGLGDVAGIDHSLDATGKPTPAARRNRTRLRGFPVDYLYWEQPFLMFAVGNQRVRVVECLVRRGANLDLKGRHPDMSAPELAREYFEQTPNDRSPRRRPGT